MVRPALFLLGWFLWLGAAEKPPVLFRVHLQAPEGAKGMVTIPLTLFNPPETIAIRSIPELSEKDILRVHASADGKILVEFNDFGRTKLELATSTGRGLILVVIVNGRVIYAPLIDIPLTKGGLALPPASLSSQEIEILNEQTTKAGKK
jgi:hypothetical protein